MDTGGWHARGINWKWLNALRAGPGTWAAYLTVYLSTGFLMNWVGASLEIARFTHWWQVFTVYGLYMVPVSLLLRHEHPFRQYTGGLLAMGLLEFGGYALGTSYAYPDNILDRLFGIRNFSLAMTLFFAAYIPLGNNLMKIVLRSSVRERETTC